MCVCVRVCVCVCAPAHTRQHAPGLQKACTGCAHCGLPGSSGSGRCQCQGQACQGIRSGRSPTTRVGTVGPQVQKGEAAASTAGDGACEHTSACSAMLSASGFNAKQPMQARRTSQQACRGLQRIWCEMPSVSSAKSLPLSCVHPHHIWHRRRHHTLDPLAGAGWQ